MYVHDFGGGGEAVLEVLPRLKPLATHAPRSGRLFGSKKFLPADSRLTGHDVPGYLCSCGRWMSSSRNTAEQDQRWCDGLSGGALLRLWRVLTYMTQSAAKVYRTVRTARPGYRVPITTTCLTNDLITRTIRSYRRLLGFARLVFSKGLPDPTANATKCSPT